MSALPLNSDVDLFGNCVRIIDFDTKVSNRTFNLRVAKQELDRAEIAGLPIDFRRLRATKRVRAVTARIEANGRHPVASQPRVLPG